MPRTPSDPVARLAKLEAARKGIGRKPPILNFVEMADVIGMTPRNLKLTIEADPAFPIRRQGGEGVPYEFDPKAVLDHMIAGARLVQAGREKHSRRVNALAGLRAAAGGEAAVNGAVPGPDAPLTVQDLSKLVQVNRDFQRVKIEQGELISAAKSEAAAIDYNNVVQSTVLDSAQRADPAGIWTTEIRAAWENETRNMLVAIQDAAQLWLEKLRTARPD